MSRAAVIELNEVRVKYEEEVLKGINLEIREGETMVIMGGSGCGKSTMLRVMTGSERPSAGTIKLFGQDLSTLDEDGLDKIRLKFGILFQSAALFASMSIAKNVAYPLREHTELDQSTIEIMTKIKLEQVGLREHGAKSPAQISGGMKKRAGIARALALDPRILFYDEPSAGLDPVTSAEIDQLIVSLTRELGVTSVVVTHEMDSAFTIADRMTMLDKGRVLMVGTRDEFDALRKVPEADAAKLGDKERLIRQFLRGDAHGPISDRRTRTDYADDLLGHIPEPAVRDGLTPSR